MPFLYPPNSVAVTGYEILALDENFAPELRDGAILCYYRPIKTPGVSFRRRHF